MAKIMLVEDDPMIAEIYVRKLTGAGFDVINARTGKEVLKLASEQTFDLVLLDMVLPEMSGMEVLKELRMSGNYDKDLKVVIFSNLGEAEVRQDALKNGASGFIEKSQFGPSELVNEINRLLREFGEQEKNRKRLSGVDVPNKVDESGRKKRVLFIEDEDIFLDMFGKKIRDEGYDLVCANNGAWGVKEALNGDFDIIITDMVMPAMTGEEIIEKIRSNEDTKDVPIIVLSASVDLPQQRKAEQLGISSFFVKTQIVPSDITRKIDEILS